MAELARKVCVITGASGGLGAELARQLGALGRFALVLAARREPELNAVASSCGCPAKAVVADVTRRADVELLLATALSEYGRCDVWINNVGRGISKSVLDLTDEDIDQVISINLKSAIYGSQVAAAHFKANGNGHIVNISSFLGKAPMAPIRSIYSASKAALNSLTSNMRMELDGTGVHVTTVLPGVIHTDFQANAIYGTPGAGTMPGQTAQEAAAPIVAAIEASPPPAEVYTQGEPQRAAALNYAQDCASAEASIAAGIRARAAAR